jgi:hypothetical protein
MTGVTYYHIDNLMKVMKIDGYYILSYGQLNKGMFFFSNISWPDTLGMILFEEIWICMCKLFTWRDCPLLFETMIQSRNELEKYGQIRLYARWGNNSTGILHPCNGNGSNWNNLLPRGLNSVGNLKRICTFLLMANTLIGENDTPTLFLEINKTNDLTRLRGDEIIYE